MKLQFVPMHVSDIVVLKVREGHSMNDGILDLISPQQWEKFKDETPSVTIPIAGRNITFYYKGGYMYCDNQDLREAGF